ncbi:helix-turn-helix transcriptional regulator [Candidatus Collierbacteria bacterium]|nr:helix-turn-helix transcriptional regulator [Candidatus Collierbacteria bacterium]
MKRYKISNLVGRRMKRVRKVKGLTQEEIADRLGIHWTTYGRIERGESNISLRGLYKIAKVLKVKLRDFL